MLNLDNLLPQYLRNIEPDHDELSEYFHAYQLVVSKFGYEPIIQPGQINILGWDLEYRCGAALANFIDQILIRRLNDFIPEHDHPLILDCGANIGFSALNYKRKFPKARVIAFEPDPEFAPLLRRNLARNGAGDVEVVEAAVWTANGTSPWKLEGIDGSHLSSGTEEASKTTTVRTIDLCDYLDQPIDLIKVDIEGAEYEVVSHIAEKLNHVKAMTIECHLTQAAMIPFGQMLQVLSAAGFKLSINSFGHWRDLIRQEPVKADHHENYVLVSTWRGSISSALTDSSWIPGAGVAPIVGCEQVVQQIFAFQAELLGALKGYTLSGERGLKRIPLKGPFQQENGFCWVAQLKDFQSMTDDGVHPHRSTLLLYEDGNLLHPGHTLHDEIRSLGAGRYSHWNGMLYFSTSDGSNPNTNGRQYRIIGIA